MKIQLRHGVRLTQQTIIVAQGAAYQRLAPAAALDFRIMRGEVLTLAAAVDRPDLEGVLLVVELYAEQPDEILPAGGIIHRMVREGDRADVDGPGAIAEPPQNCTAHRMMIDLPPRQAWAVEISLPVDANALKAYAPLTRRRSDAGRLHRVMATTVALAALAGCAPLPPGPPNPPHGAPGHMCCAKEEIEDC